MSSKKGYALGLLISIAALGQSLPLWAQEDNPLDPANFSTPIAKKLAGQISESAELRKTMVDFVNNAQAPLMCKLSVSRVWEQALRGKAALDLSRQSQAEAAAALGQNLSKMPEDMARRMAESRMVAERNLMATLTRELAVTFGLIDTYCGSSGALK